MRNKHRCGRCASTILAVCLGILSVGCATNHTTTVTFTDTATLVASMTAVQSNCQANAKPPTVTLSNPGNSSVLWQANPASDVSPESGVINEKSEATITLTSQQSGAVKIEWLSTFENEANEQQRHGTITIVVTCAS